MGEGIEPLHRAVTKRMEEIMRKFYNRLKEKGQKGFTLIELMIVIAIIGILAAIAIPQFAAYRTKAFNAAALSDLRNFKTTMEADYADNQQYQVMP